MARQFCRVYLMDMLVTGLYSLIFGVTTIDGFDIFSAGNILIREWFFMYIFQYHIVSNNGMKNAYLNE